MGIKNVSGRKRMREGGGYRMEGDVKGLYVRQKREMGRMPRVEQLTHDIENDRENT